MGIIITILIIVVHTLVNSVTAASMYLHRNFCEVFYVEDEYSIGSRGDRLVTTHKLGNS